MHWLRRLVHKQQSERELDAELRFHLERQIAENIRAGMDPVEARRHAQIEFGGLEPSKEACREARRGHLPSTLMQDAAYGLRLLRKNPGFTAAAVATLALGIGANTAIFSIVNAVILRPLPYPDSARIVSVNTKSALFPTFDLGNSWIAFQRIRSQAPSLEQSAVYWQSEKTATGQGDPAQLSVSWVSDGFFEEMGTKAERGRLLGPQDQNPGQNRVAVISDALWRTRFGSDPGVVGKALVLDKQVYTIVGVAARDFDFPSKNDAWTPVALTEDMEHSPTSFMFPLVGKLRPGRSAKQLEGELVTIGQQMLRDYPQLGGGLGFKTVALLDEQVHGQRAAYLTLLGASVLVLLISCANLASLLLARGASRQREMALRAALGASRGRLLRQGLVESVLIALLGAAAGAALAAGGVRLFRAVAPGNTPRLGEISIDATLLWFSLATSLAAGLLFGLAPARRAARMDPNDALKEGAGATGVGGQPVRQSRLSSALVVVEVTLAFVLLIGSALMTQTVRNILQQNPGFETEHVLTFDLPSPPLMSEPGPQFVREQATRLERIMEQVRAVPGVAAVTASDYGLLTGMTMMRSGLQVEGAVVQSSAEERHASIRYVYPAYFRTLGMPLVRGRDFTERDIQDAPRVVIVNEAMARAYWGTPDVVGRRLSISQDEKGNPNWWDVVGVVADAREVRLNSAPRPEYYLSLLQGGSGNMHLMVRAASDPEGLAGAITRRIWNSYPDQPVTHVSTLSQLIAESVGDRRLRSVLLAVFAGIGCALALLGVYGILAYSVSRRVREIGVRAALGASRGALLLMFWGQGLFLVATGVALGSAAAFGLARTLASQLYGVQPADVPTFLGAAALLLVVSCLACSIPARRAMRVDPMTALRYE